MCDLTYSLQISIMSSVSHHFKPSAVLYADDSSLIGPVCSFKSTSYKFDNNELEKHSEWLSVNKLSLNAGKTKYMLHRFPQHSYTCSGDNVQFSNYATL